MSWSVLCRGKYLRSTCAPGSSQPATAVAKATDDAGRSLGTGLGVAGVRHCVYSSPAPPPPVFLSLSPSSALMKILSAHPFLFGDTLAPPVFLFSIVFFSFYAEAVFQPPHFFTFSYLIFVGCFTSFFCLVYRLLPRFCFRVREGAFLK